MSLPTRIVLTGFSGTGKSTVGPLLAKALGWELVDTDSMVEEQHGPIGDIFRKRGEAHFRELEADALREACSRENAVIVGGGGVVISSKCRRLMADGGFVVCLEARPDTILHRLREDRDVESFLRPLLDTPDPLTRIRELKAARQSVYVLCDWTVHVDALAPEQVVEEIVRARDRLAPGSFSDPDRLANAAKGSIASDSAAVIRTSSSSYYPVIVRWGALGGLGRSLRDAQLARRVYVISDEQVWHHIGDEVEASLSAAEVPFESYIVPPGEATKTLDTASEIYDWLIEKKSERGHTIVTVGGGMVTDLGGYVAATFARGLPLVHVPTSVLGMVDAAIGGKVAVNHARAKNMIGAFYQPKMVLADPAVLRTLPEREHSGWAEAIKHAMIADEGYLRFFEDNAEGILKLDPEVTTEAISRSVAIKAGVVMADEKETTGRRATLNYGHTLAHAIESTTNYERFRHGEADAIGMMCAAEISRGMGLLAEDVIVRQKAVLEKFKLPTSADGLDREKIMAAIALDKKVRANKVRWVLLEGIGSAVLRDDVPAEVVEAALDTVL
ncbi:MAG: 3-dehydroquinate synthase [Chloroflexi bacterium]|nr:3-dehydroquinate synthase [Chloroflexota bacterium]